MYNILYVVYYLAYDIYNTFHIYYLMEAVTHLHKTLGLQETLQYLCSSFSLFLRTLICTSPVPGTQLGKQNGRMQRRHFTFSRHTHSHGS